QCGSVLPTSAGRAAGGSDRRNANALSEHAAAEPGSGAARAAAWAGWNQRRVPETGGPARDQRQLTTLPSRFRNVRFGIWRKFVPTKEVSARSPLCTKRTSRLQYDVAARGIRWGSAFSSRLNYRVWVPAGRVSP